MGSKLSDIFRGLLRPGSGAGGESGGAAGRESGAEVEYKGYAIRPAPFQEGSHWVTAAVISKAFEGEVREHRFVRADMFPAREGAEEFAVVRAKRVIDELGDRLFDEG